MSIVKPTNLAVLNFRGIHLYHADISNCAARVRLLLEEKGLKWESHHINLRKRENVTAEYFGINPRGLVPTLVDDGTVVIESNDILRYVEEKFPEPSFLPLGATARNVVNEWLDLSGSIHMPGIKTYQYVKVNAKLLQKTPAEVALYRSLQRHEDLLTFHGKHDLPGQSFSDQDFSAAVAMLNDAFSRIEGMLTGNEWMVENTYTLADISWATTLTTLLRGGFPFEPYPNIRAWYARIGLRPAFKSAVIAWNPGGERFAG